MKVKVIQCMVRNPDGTSNKCNNDDDKGTLSKCSNYHKSCVKKVAKTNFDGITKGEVWRQCSEKNRTGQWTMVNEKDVDIWNNYYCKGDGCNGSTKSSIGSLTMVIP